MVPQRVPFFILLLLLISSHACILSRSAEARTLPNMKQTKYVKVMESLGLMCQCCDGVGGECNSTWDSTCTKLDCHPWKFL